MVKREIRNIKGEIIQNANDDEPWYQLSAETWFLIGGLTVLISGCFYNPKIIDGLFRFLDFRLWPWWYFVVLFLSVAFSIKWYLLAQSWDDLDLEDIEIGKQFLRMSITITIEMLILILLKATGLLSHFYNPLERWLGFGDYSHMGLLSFLLICLAVAVTVYVVKEWFTAAFQS